MPNYRFESTEDLIRELDSSKERNEISEAINILAAVMRQYGDQIDDTPLPEEYEKLLKEIEADDTEIPEDVLREVEQKIFGISES